MNTYASLTHPSPGTSGTLPAQPAFPGFDQRTHRARSKHAFTRPRAGKEGEAAMIALYANPILTIVCISDDAPAPYSLEAASQLTGVHPEMLRYYCRIGLLGARREETAGNPTFDNALLDEIGRIEHYRRNLGVNRRALPLICQLWRECERQQIDLFFLRGPRPRYGDARRAHSADAVHPVRVTPHGSGPAREGRVSGWLSAFRSRLHA